jgi:regulatory protein
VDEDGSVCGCEVERATAKNCAQRTLRRRCRGSQRKAGNVAFQRAKAGLFEYAVGALSRRMRTVRDLKRLMKARAHPGAVGEADMDRVVARLIELKYLSDTRFAQDYTRLRKENQGLGRRRVAQDLAVKGVDKELATATLEEAYGETDEVELARAYCERKRIPQPKEPKEVNRVMNRLMRAGYGAGAIYKLLRSWKLEVPEPAGDSDQYGDLPEF